MERISVVVPALNEEGNITRLMKEIREVLGELKIDYDLIVVDGDSKDRTKELALEAGAKIITQKKKGFGNALKEGFEAAKGDYIITIDGDFSHNPLLIRDLWLKKDSADIVICSRYVKGGGLEINLFRKVLSIMLNKFFSLILLIPVKDMSSNFRLYNKDVLENISIKGKDFNALQEILVRAYKKGFKITEIPFSYEQRRTGKSKMRLIKFGLSYMISLIRLSKLRYFSK